MAKSKAQTHQTNRYPFSNEHGLQISMSTSTIYRIYENLETFLNNSPENMGFKNYVVNIHSFTLNH